MSTAEQKRRYQLGDWDDISRCTLVTGCSVETPQTATLREGYTMNARQIIDAVDEGYVVYWKTLNYIVVADDIGQYFIKCQSNGNLIGLTWSDGVTLNGSLEDFFI